MKLTGWGRAAGPLHWELVPSRRQQRPRHMGPASAGLGLGGTVL